MDPRKTRQQLIDREVRKASRGMTKAEVARESKIRQAWAVDFDGTLCQNRWPEIGPENTELIKLLKSAKKSGVALILWTCREGQLLDNALAWCAERGLHFDAANENLPERVSAYRNDPRKISADLYLDDRSVQINWKDWSETLWTTVTTQSETT